MKKQLLILLLLATIFSNKVFAGGDFGMGGIFTFNSDMDTVNNSRFGLSGGLTMGFGEKEKPVVWDLLMGSKSHLPYFQSVFTMETRIDFQVFSFSPVDSLVLFMGPGFAFGLGVQWPNLDKILSTSNVPDGIAGSFDLHIVGRLVAGIKYFAGDHVEFFLQVAPQLGWQLLAITSYERTTGPVGSITNSFYWSVEMSTGIRFWN